MEKVYRVNKEKIRTILADLITMPGVEVANELDFSLLFSLWPSPIPDYGYAVAATVCQGIPGATVFTFDKNFTATLKKAGLLARSHV